jgi:hypothetical protein
MTTRLIRNASVQLAKLIEIAQQRSFTYASILHELIIDIDPQQKLRKYCKMRKALRRSDV